MIKLIQMKKIALAVFAFLCIALVARGENQERKLPVFTEISLRIPAKLYLEQGTTQKVVIDATTSDLEDIITEIKDRALVIRFPAKNYLWKPSHHDNITIHITIPEITGLNLSGSGDIIGENAVSSLIMDLNVSGSGNIKLDDLNAERVKTNISGSGNIILRGNKPATEFNASIAGSGNIKAENFEAKEVKVTIAGSGNCSIKSNGNINVRIAGSGNLYYAGNPLFCAMQHPQ
jgi:hypothetical protein